jgi:hypothetical protein
MGIGYFQLTVISEQDKYLVGNPEFTYFKAVYKRHTNFAKEIFHLNFVGETFMSSDNTLGKKLYCTIPRNGDLLHRIYIVFDIQSNNNIPVAVDSIQQNIIPHISVDAQALIESVEIKIGDQTIDKHTGEWMHIYNELYLGSSKNQMLCDMINTNINVKEHSASQKDGLIYIPLNFWFNKNPGLSLPLIALQYSDVKIDLKLNPRTKISNISMRSSSADPIQINGITMLAEYIHLDNQEKRLFSSNSHEYLIEQVQYCNNINVPLRLSDIPNDNQYNEYQHKFEIPFNHPIKELIWGIQDDCSNVDATGSSNYNEDGDEKTRCSIGNHLFNYWFNLDYNTTTKLHQMIDGTISLNGVDMFDPMSSNYFMSLLRYQHYNGFGYQNLASEAIGGLPVPDVLEAINVNYNNGSGFYCYSFALNPMDYQPSGSLNFSKLDKAELKIRLRRNQLNTSLRQKLLKIYGVNYNILRIMSGDAGLAFSN